MITWVDWIIWSVYFLLFYAILWFYRHTKGNEVIYKWFLKGFVIKAFGGIAFALVHVYYYRGDTLLYFRGATILSELIPSDFSTYLKLLLSEDGKLSNDLAFYAQSISYAKTPAEWFMVKILSVFSFFSFNSYITLTLLLNVLSFWGAWKLFRVFSNLIKNNDNYVFIIIFCTPSILFWGSGILKDTITLTLINYIIYTVYFKTNLFNFTLSTFFGIIIFKLKSYIILAFLPTIVYYNYYNIKEKISSTLLKNISTPILMVLFSVIGFVGIQNVTKNTKFSQDKIEKQARGFHTWHASTGGSVYDLGEIEYTPIGLVKKIPLALNATFFRPYIWTARNPIMLVGALESTLVLLFFIYVLYLTKLNPVKYLYGSSFMLSLMFFILIFGFAVGFTSYNFGALARYKMPVFSLFILSLLYIYNKVKTTNV